MRFHDDRDNYLGKKKKKHYIKEPHKILRKKVHAFFNPKKKE